MSLTFLPPALRDALGGTLVYEELRGDLTAARALAEQGLAAGGAPALLARGVVHLLQGEPAEAIARLDAADAAAPDDAALQLMACACSVLATYQRYLVFPHGGNSSTLTIGSRWSFRDHAVETDARWSALRSRVSDAGAALDAELVCDVLQKLPAGRFLLDRSRQIAPPADLERRATMMLRPLLGFRARAEAAGAEPRVLAFVDRATADLLWRARYKADAATLLGRAQTLSEGDEAGTAACWMLLGDWLSAPASSPLVHNHLMLEGDWSGALSWVDDRLERDRSEMDLAGAEQAYAAARQGYEGAGARRGAGAAMLRQGYLEALAGHHEEAGALASEALAHFEATGDTLNAWLARSHQAIAAIGAPGRVADTALAEQIGAWGRTTGSLSFATGLGLLFTREGRRWLTGEGDYARALACHGLARTLFSALGAPDNAAQVRVDEGAVHAAIGEHRAAMEAYEEAREGYAALVTSVPGLATAAWQKAVLTADAVAAVAVVLRDADAIERSTARLERLHAAPPPPSGPDLFGADFPDSMPRLIALRVENAAMIVPLLRAAAARDAGEGAPAEALFASALAAARAASAEARDLLEAVALRTMDRQAEAAEAFHRYRDRGGPSAGLTGDLAARIGERFGEAGRAIAARQPEQTPWFAASFAASVGAFAEARAALDELVRARGDAWWADDERPWEGMVLDARVSEGLGDLDAALTRYDAAVHELEARRTRLSRDEMKLALAGQQSAQDVYFGATRAALRAAALDPSHTTRFARAFDFAERDRARALLDLMTERGSPPACAEPLRALRSASAEIEVLRSLVGQERRRDTPDATRVADLARRIEEQERRIRALDAELTAAGGGFLPGEVLSLDAACALLPEGAALLQYAFLGEDLLAWAITRHGPAAIHLATVDARALARQMRAYHRACADRAPVEALGAALAATLLAPLAAAIDASTHLVIVPFGAGHLVPFQALPYGGQPLGVGRTVAYLPSASSLRFLRPWMDERRDRVLAVGNPSGMRYRPVDGGPERPLAPLPGAEAEAALVASLFPEKLLLLGAHATVDEVGKNLRDYAFVHLATHGFLSEEAPLLSSLMLADGGQLTVRDLLGMELDAELVVLSACETARGATSGGEGVLGLTRGLLAAGARAAVVSLWPVEDASTSLLMRRFYVGLREGLPPAAALREAEIHVRDLEPAEAARERDEVAGALRDSGATDAAARFVAGARDLGPAAARQGAEVGYDHPYYWAPFVMVGLGV